MVLKALLFDLDGTLADTESQGHRPAYNQAFDELGIGWHWSPRLYRELLLQQGGRERIRHYLQNHNPLLSDPHKQQVEKNANRWVQKIHDRKSRHFTRLIKAGQVRLRCGVARLLAQAHQQGLKLGIVTNASSQTLEPFLHHCLGDELRAVIAQVVRADQVAHKKPAPDVYLRALEMLGVQADECIAIEDSEAGLLAADAAQIPTLITVNADTREQDFARAMLVVSQLGDAAHPFTVLSGDAGDARWVSVELLRRLSAEHGYRNQCL